MKKIVICSKYYKHITDEDFEKLRNLSPGLARSVKTSSFEAPTHFVCEKCGQVPPVKLKPLHGCTNNNDLNASGNRLE